jgi:hypothetical protein
MALQLKVVNKKTLKDLNDAIANLQFLYGECEKAEKAGVPGLEAAKQNCSDLHDRIQKFKSVYFANEV